MRSGCNRRSPAARARFKGGLVDINTTFDVQETAALFLNASHGIGPDLGDTGFNGPSDYPTTALAVTGVCGRPTTGRPSWASSTASPAIRDHRAAFVAIDLAARYGALVIGQVEKRFGDRPASRRAPGAYTAAFPSLDQFGPGGAPAQGPRERWPLWPGRGTAHRRRWRRTGA